MSEEEIVHSGIIEKIEENYLQVRIRQQAACSGCQMSARCNTAEGREHLIRVYDEDARCHSVGDNVEIACSRTMGRKAVMMAFFWPLLLLLAALLACYLLTGNELSAVVAGLAVLAPYYIILHKTRGRWAKEMKFTIKDKQ